MQASAQEKLNVGLEPTPGLLILNCARSQHGNCCNGLDLYTPARLKNRKANNPDFKRVFGSRYMDFRQRTETKLRDLFRARGSKPERQSPHYFVLGDCDWFSGQYTDSSKATLDWRILPQTVASFTYPDSFILMRLGTDYGLPPEPLQPYHERVFFLDELVDVVAKHGKPEGRVEEEYDGYQNRKFEKYIKVQLWSDAPVAQYLRSEH